MNLDPQRYVTFKRAELAVVISEANFSMDISRWKTTMESLSELELTDVIVIRKKDAFAGPALHTYASTILTMVDLLTQMIAITPEERERLTELAQYFAEAAEEADHLAQSGIAKLPDWD